MKWPLMLSAFIAFLAMIIAVPGHAWIQASLFFYALMDQRRR